MKNTEFTVYCNCYMVKENNLFAETLQYDL